MKSFLAIVFLICSLCALGKDIIQKTNKRTYKVTVNTTVKHKGSDTSSTDLFLGYLKTNDYQKVTSFEPGALAEVSKFGKAGDFCIYYKLNLGKNTTLGKKVELTNEYVIETYDYTVDLGAIDTIYPYDKNDPNYYYYVYSNLPFIDVRNEELMYISRVLEDKSSNKLDYAKNCYLYVAEMYDYGQALTGFKSLDYILHNQVGDCGNLTSIFVTLLRIEGIPARHLVGFRPNGSLHVWADFYLANYGWIPVDVTYKHDYPEGDYFGKVKFKEAGFIVHRDIGHAVYSLDSPMRIPGLQTYSYINEKENVVIKREVTSELIGS